MQPRTVVFDRHLQPLLLLQPRPLESPEIKFTAILFLQHFVMGSIAILKGNMIRLEGQPYFTADSVKGSMVIINHVPQTIATPTSYGLVQSGPTPASQHPSVFHVDFHPESIVLGLNHHAFDPCFLRGVFHVRSLPKTARNQDRGPRVKLFPPFLERMGIRSQSETCAAQRIEPLKFELIVFELTVIGQIRGEIKPIPDGLDVIFIVSAFFLLYQLKGNGILEGYRTPSIVQSV